MAIGNTLDKADQYRPTTAGDLREIVVQAGVDILARDGLMLRPETISYAKVFAYLEQEYAVRVTRGSVHERIWSGHDDFRRDVLVEALQKLPLGVSVGDELGQPPTLLEQVEESLRHEHPLDHFAREVGWTQWRHSIESPVYTAIQSLKAIASRFNDPVTAEVLLSELRQRDDLRLEAGPRVLRAVIRRLGRRIRPDLGLTELEGCTLFYQLNDVLYIGGHLNNRASCTDLSSPVNDYRPSGGGEREWIVASVAFNAFLHFLTENVEAGEEPEPLEAVDLHSMDDSPRMMIDSVAKPGQRRSREELRQLVLAAGQELLLRDGLALQPEALRYSTVLAYVKEQHGLVVNRASIHGRIWASHDDFCLEVIARSIADAPTETVYGVAEAVDDLSIIPSPGDDRLRYVHKGLRHWSERQVENFSDSHRVRQRLLVKAALIDMPSSTAWSELGRVIKEVDRQQLEAGERLFIHQVFDLGYKVRPELGISTEDAVVLLSEVAQAVNLGTVFNRLSGVDDGTQRFALRRVGQDATDVWNLGGVALRACFDHFFVEHDS